MKLIPVLIKIAELFVNFGVLDTFNKFMEPGNYHFVAVHSRKHDFTVFFDDAIPDIVSSEEMEVFVYLRSGEPATFRYIPRISFF